MANHGNTHYAHSMIDMMTSLAVLFILIAAYLMQSAAKDKERARIQAAAIEISRQATMSLRNELVKSLSEFFKEGAGLKVNSDPNDPNLLAITIEDQVLQFETGEFALKKTAEPLVHSLAQVLKKVAKDPRYEKALDYVVIEGHTSNTGGLTKNVELSQKRSFAVLKKIIAYLDQESGKDETEKTTRLLSSTGHWYNRPLDEEHPESLINQRVEIRIRIKSQLPGDKKNRKGI
ncbi:hypothetical protein EBR03_06425 [bacterium]|nr:hypothetical protein [bacterium]